MADRKHVELILASRACAMNCDAFAEQLEDRKLYSMAKEMRGDAQRLTAAVFAVTQTNLVPPADTVDFAAIAVSDFDCPAIHEPFDSARG